MDCLRNLQYRQELHDRFFHNDIYTLSKHRRLEHLTLHHVKYTAQLMETVELIAGDTEESRKARGENWGVTHSFIQRRCLDGLLVCLSMLNVMNIKVGEVWDTNRTWGLDKCSRHGVYAAGRLAKLIEDIDHMVMVGVTDGVRREVGILIKVYEHFLWSYGFAAGDNPEAEVRFMVFNRLLELEQRHMFFDRYMLEIDILMDKRAQRVQDNAT
jgi:hypothetical protein